ncbi:MAG TPA: RpiB/LacA/LacB family sugar-phosphate isomerase [Opitutales bacterium]|nr:RpiB/LacA/LacB family sugar-phosphate isomerase [Opitutales bacterium]
MKLALASDHAGFELKQHLLGVVKTAGHDAADLGALTVDPADDYPDFAETLGRAVAKGDFERGILICGSGVGAAVAANKIKGVRAGLCHDSYSAHQGVEHDDMNVLVFGSRVIGPALAEDLVRVFLAAKFTGEPRHLRRLQKVKAIEARG